MYVDNLAQRKRRGETNKYALMAGKQTKKKELTA
jgi:hypothetical protein